MATQTPIAQWLVEDIAGARLEPYQQEELAAWTRVKASRTRFLADLHDAQLRMDDWNRYHEVDIEAAWVELQAMVAAIPELPSLPDLTYARRDTLLRLDRIRHWGTQPWVSVACMAVLLCVGILTYRGGKQEQETFENEEPLGSTSISWSGGPRLLLADINWGWMLQFAGWTIFRPEPQKTIFSRDPIYKNAVPVDSDHVLVSTAAGGIHSVVLPDGSKVDLYAASHLQIPPTYGVVSRDIDLEGEGFFDVKTDAWNFYQQKGPFVVHADRRLTITAWGTEFNVKAYSNDSSIRTTLLSGSVQVQYEDRVVRLKAGDTYVLRRDGTDTVMHQEKVNPLWTNGKFNFDDTPLDEMLNELARWYGANVVYRQRPQGKRFNLFVFRDEPLSSVLKHLNETNTVQFSLDENTNTIFVSETH